MKHQSCSIASEVLFSEIAFQLSKYVYIKNIFHLHLKSKINRFFFYLEYISGNATFEIKGDID